MSFISSFAKYKFESEGVIIAVLFNENLLRGTPWPGIHRLTSNASQKKAPSSTVSPVLPESLHNSHGIQGSSESILSVLIRSRNDQIRLRNSSGKSSLNNSRPRAFRLSYTNVLSA